MKIDVNLSANINDISEKKTTLASGWVELDGVIRFPVHVRQYTDSKDGRSKYFVSYPQRKSEGGGYTGILYPSTAEVRKEIDSRVLAEFHDLVVNRKWEEVPVEEARVTRVEPRGGSKVRLVGRATVKVSGVTINGIQVKEGQYGIIVQMPQYLDKNGEYRDLVYATNRVMQDAISDAVTSAYNSPEGIFRREEKEEEADFYEEWLERVYESGNDKSEGKESEQQGKPGETADAYQNEERQVEAEDEHSGQETKPDTTQLMENLAVALQNHDKLSVQEILIKLPLAENRKRKQSTEGREIRVWDYSEGSQTASLMLLDGYLDSSSIEPAAACVQQVAVAWTDAEDLSVLSETIMFFEGDNPEQIEENRALAQGFVTLVTGEKVSGAAPEVLAAAQKPDPAAEKARMRAPTTLRQPRK